MYKNHISVKQYAPDGEKYTLPSQTIKGESYTIKELLQKHVRGMLPPNIDASPQYSPDPEDLDQPDLNQISKMDVTDQQILRQNNRSQQKDLLQEIKEVEEKKAKELLEKAESIAKGTPEDTQPQTNSTESEPKAKREK